MSDTKKTRLVGIIDGSNLFVNLRDRQLPTRLQYTRLGIRVAKALPKNLDPWIYQNTTYVCSSPRRERGEFRWQQWRRFQEMLHKTNRLTLKLGRLEGPPGDTHEKGVDSIVTTTLLVGALQDTYDVAILFSGDGDYAPVVDEVRAAGKKVYVAFFRDTPMHHLKQAANGFIDISGFDFENLRFYRRR